MSFCEEDRHAPWYLMINSGKAMIRAPHVPLCHTPVGHLSFSCHREADTNLKPRPGCSRNCFVGVQQLTFMRHARDNSRPPGEYFCTCGSIRLSTKISRGT